MDSEAKKKKKQAPMIQSHVWQALACLSWLKDIFISETCPANARVCELNCFLSAFATGAEISKFIRAGVATYVGVDGSAEHVERARHAGKGAKLAQEYYVENPFGPLFAGVPAGNCDCVYVFNDTHMVMESRDSASRFFANAARVLKQNGLLVMLMHDGGSMWYALQKDMPETLPPGYKPHFKRKLFSVTVGGGLIDKRIVGVKVGAKSCCSCCVFCCSCCVFCCSCCVFCCSCCVFCCSICVFLLFLLCALLFLLCVLLFLLCVLLFLLCVL
jgi:SAM-dependent methyltransferase